MSECALRQGYTYRFQEILQRDFKKRLGSLSFLRLLPGACMNGSCALPFSSDGKDSHMKLTVQYDNRKQIIDLSREETDQLWVSLSLECSDQASLEDRERMIQDAFDAQYNRPEYNNWHTYSRHTGYGPSDEGDQDGGGFDMDAFPDSRFGEEFDITIEDEEFTGRLRRTLKSDQADLLIAVCINHVPKQDYAAQLGISPSALSHRLETAMKNFKKFFC